MRVAAYRQDGTDGTPLTPPKIICLPRACAAGLSTASTGSASICWRRATPAYAGSADGGTYQKVGDVEAMRGRVCTGMRDFALLPGAGHWVQQEQPAAVLERLIAFLR